MLECQKLATEVVMIAAAVGDIRMALANLLILPFFFQYHTFLEEIKNETTVMTIYRSLYKLFWTKEDGPDPLA